MLFILLATGQGVAQNTSRVVDHIGITTDMRSGEVINSLNSHIVPNEGMITKFNSVADIDWSYYYDADGKPFVAWESLDFFPDLVFLGTVEHRQNVLMKINHLGTVVWTRRYSEEFDEMTKSYGGEILMARGDNTGMPFVHLAEVSATDGSIMNESRIGFRAFSSGSNIKVLEIERSPRGYFLIVEIDGMIFSLTVDSSLNPLNATHLHMENGDEMKIVDILKSNRGDFYFLSANLTNDHLIVGRLSDTHQFSDVRDVEIASADIRFEFSTSDSRIVESPNLIPYYGEKTTNNLNLKAVTYVASIRDNNTNWEREFVIQFNEFFDLNCAMAYNVNPGTGSIGSVQIHKKNSNKLVLSTMIGMNGSLNRHQTHFLADDFTGCFAESVTPCVKNINAVSNGTGLEILQGELSLEGMDGNNGHNEFASSPLCTMNKTSEFENEIESDLSEVEIKVYPNPSTGLVYLNAPAGSSVQVFDLQGRIIHRIDALQSNQSTLPELTRGLYIVRVQTTTGNHQQKLIVE